MIRLLAVAVLTNSVSILILNRRLGRVEQTATDLTRTAQELFSAVVELLPPPTWIDGE